MGSALRAALHAIDEEEGGGHGFRGSSYYTEPTDHDFLNNSFSKRPQSARISRSGLRAGKASTPGSDSGASSCPGVTHSFVLKKGRSISFNYALPLNSLSLTHIEKSMVRRAWSYSRRHETNEEPGLSILRHIFYKSEEIRTIFGQTIRLRKDDSSLELSKDLQTAAADGTLNQALSSEADIDAIFDRFQLSMIAQRLTKVMDLVVANLEKLPAVEQDLADLGKRHVDLVGCIHRIKPKHWDCFAEAMISQSLKWGGNFHKFGNNSRTTECWVKICLFIVECVRRGYQTELRQRKRSLRATTSMEILLPSNHCGAGNLDQSQDSNNNSNRLRGPINSNLAVDKPSDGVASISDHSTIITSSGTAISGDQDGEAPSTSQNEPLNSDQKGQESPGVMIRSRSRSESYSTSSRGTERSPKLMSASTNETSVDVKK